MLQRIGHGAQRGRRYAGGEAARSKSWEGGFINTRMQINIR